MSLNLNLEEKRDEVLYVRIKGSNKNFIINEAGKQGISEAEYVDKIFDRVTSVSKKSRLKRNSSKN